MAAIWWKLDPHLGHSGSLLGEMAPKACRKGAKWSQMVPKWCPNGVPKFKIQLHTLLYLEFCDIYALLLPYIGSFLAHLVPFSVANTRPQAEALALHWILEHAARVPSGGLNHCKV